MTSYISNTPSVPLLKELNCYGQVRMSGIQSFNLAILQAASVTIRSKIFGVPNASKPRNSMLISGVLPVRTQGEHVGPNILLLCQPATGRGLQNGPKVLGGTQRTRARHVD